MKTTDVCVHAHSPIFHFQHKLPVTANTKHKLPVTADTKHKLPVTADTKHKLPVTADTKLKVFLGFKCCQC